MSPRCIPLLLVLLLPRTAAAAGPRDYWPLEKGGSWHYSVHRDVTLEMVDGPTRRSFLRGREDEQVLQVDRTGVSAAVTLRRVTSVREMGQGEEQVTRSEQRYRAGPRGIFLLRTEPATEPRVDYEPPLRLLNRLEPGATWEVGSMRRGSLTIPLGARVIGVEDVTEDAVTYPDCLVVQYGGDIEGVFWAPDGDMRLDGGHYERRVWYSPGLGMVRDITRDRIELHRPGDDERLVRSQVTTRRLVSYRPAASTSAGGTPGAPGGSTP